ncbi:MAG: hypothetical protein IJQ90_04480 [Alphaproteobacteria bacterium]|nr:hypothetical protein [Alphaproteobacteria bacterium]
MKPEVFTRFNATTHFPGLVSIEHGNVSNINELREFVNKFGPRDDRTYRVTILRESCVVNMDKKIKNIPFYHQNRYIDGHPIIATDTDAKIELILPQLMYPNDVAEYLIKKYGQKFDFKPENFDLKTPMFLDICEHSSIGLRNSRTGAPTHMKWHTVDCEPLSEKDIVVDKNLNQLWPEKTGKLPVGLVELFNRGTEKVH